MQLHGVPVGSVFGAVVLGLGFLGLGLGVFGAVVFGAVGFFGSGAVGFGDSTVRVNREARIHEAIPAMEPDRANRNPLGIHRHPRVPMTTETTPPTIAATRYGLIRFMVCAPCPISLFPPMKDWRGVVRGAPMRATGSMSLVRESPPHPTWLTQIRSRRSRATRRPRRPRRCCCRWCRTTP